jgi:branched-chain amino acid transport system substrate-binding protein
MIEYIGDQEGGMDKLAGKKIALVYHDSAYGKEPIPTLKALADKYGYEFHEQAVAHPGVEQKSNWHKIGRQLRPDWVLMWGWGVMNSTAIKEAAAVGYPMDHFIGVWWSGAEVDVEPAGDAAKGYKSATFHAAGTEFPVFDDVFRYVYDKGLGTAERDKVGEVLYNRGLINAMIVVEAIRTAQAIYGQQPLTGEQVRDGLENLDITEERLAELGMTGFTPPIKVSCADHEGDHAMQIQQWDGAHWEAITDWIEPMKDVVRPMIEASAESYAKEKGITPRSCSS